MKRNATRDHLGVPGVATLHPLDSCRLQRADGPSREETFEVAILDIETTGLDIDCDLIELAIVRARVGEETGLIYGEPVCCSWLSEPSAPLPPKIVELTGLSDEKLEGHEIDWQGVEHLLEGARLIIAHNAGFDRPRFERVAAAAGIALPKVPWLCSYRQVEWRDNHRAPAAALEALCWLFGFYQTEGHRALSDCRSLLLLLQRAGELAGLVDRAFEPRHRLEARRAAFECKDKLKARGYRWDSAARVWHTEIGWQDNEELPWLEANIWGRGFRPHLSPIDPLTRWRG